ncbi:class I SAM-dependent methyltransferase [Planctomycetota bacterium]
MSNRWNRLIYWLWSPFYDLLSELLFRVGRRRAMEVLCPQVGERVGLIGVGTGADLLLLPEGVYGIGVDLSEAMLARARRKIPGPGRHVELIVGDAHELPLASGVFDVIVLNLVLSVVPNAARCMAESLRILRPGGRLVVFDKFLPDNTSPSWLRRLANFFCAHFGTDINRRLGDIIAGQACRIAQDEASLLGGMYRVILLEKSAESVPVA